MILYSTITFNQSIGGEHFLFRIRKVTMFSPTFWQLIINKCCALLFFLFFCLDTSIAVLLTSSQIPYKKGKAHTVCFPLFLNKRWRLKEMSAENLSILLANNGKLEFNGMSYIGLPQHPHFALNEINAASWQIGTVFSIFKFLVSEGIIR